MKLKTGDIFNIEIHNLIFCFGQIIYIPDNNHFMIVIFQESYSEIPEFKTICSGVPLFMGYTLDAKLYNKHWNIIGNHEVMIDFEKLPYHKLNDFNGEIIIVDYKEDYIRKSEEVDVDLNYKKVVAPVRYENAIKAYHNIGDWNVIYDTLKWD